MISGTPVFERGHFGHILVMKMLYFFYNFVEACKFFAPFGSSSCVEAVTFVVIYFNYIIWRLFQKGSRSPPINIYILGGYEKMH